MEDLLGGLLEGLSEMVGDFLFEMLSEGESLPGGGGEGDSGGKAVERYKFLPDDADGSG